VATVSSHYSDAAAGAFVAETLSARKIVVDANDSALVTIFKYYDDDNNGTLDLNEVRMALSDFFRISQGAFEDYPCWAEDEDGLTEELILDFVQDVHDEVPEGVEVRLDFAEFSSLALEFVRYSTLSMIQVKHDHKRNATQHQRSRAPSRRPSRRPSRTQSREPSRPPSPLK